MTPLTTVLLTIMATIPAILAAPANLTYPITTRVPMAGGPDTNPALPDAPCPTTPFSNPQCCHADFLGIVDLGCENRAFSFPSVPPYPHIVTCPGTIWSPPGYV